MARRTRTPSPPPPKSAEPEADVISLSISAQISEETFTYYANHAEIACTPHEFAILLARMPTKLPSEKLEEARSGTLILTCDVQLIPATLISGLIRALNTQKATYEQRYGVIHEPGGSHAESGS